MALQDLLDDFALFDNWEDRYRYIIELGQSLASLAENEYSDTYKVHGCASQVWLVSKLENGQLIIRGDSDAHIVKGLIAILIDLYSGQPTQNILAQDITDIFQQLGLSEHLSAQRSNGFYAMVQRIRKDSEAASSVCNP